MDLTKTSLLSPCSALSPATCRVFAPATTIGFHGGRKKFVAPISLDKRAGRNEIGMAYPNYAVPLDMPSPGLIRPLAEILRDLNSRVSEKIINPDSKSIPWYHANRMLSFYAPGWCGEVRDVTFSDDERVTVVYRVTLRGSDGEAHRESTGTVSLKDAQVEDPVAAAEEIAFCKACARFGFGLHLYHED